MKNTSGSAKSAIILRRVLETNGRDLLAYFERRVIDPQDAADLLGETMLTLWRRIDALPADDERRRMWLFVTARNVLSNYRRAGVRRAQLADELRKHLLTSPPPSPDDAWALRDAVARLPEPLRELVSLIHWDGFSLVEAAEITGTNPSTARGRYATAKAQLKSALTESAGSGL